MFLCLRLFFCLFLHCLRLKVWGGWEEVAPGLGLSGSSVPRIFQVWGSAERDGKAYLGQDLLNSEAWQDRDCGLDESTSYCRTPNLMVAGNLCRTLDQLIPLPVPHTSTHPLVPFWSTLSRCWAGFKGAWFWHFLFLFTSAAESLTRKAPLRHFVFSTSFSSELPPGGPCF